MPGIGQRWRISLQPQTCCSTSLHTHAYAQIRTQSSVANFCRSAHAFPHHPCPVTSLPGFWVCAWPQRMVALSCCFKEEEDQAAALRAMPPSQDRLEALRHPSSFNLPAPDRPSQVWRAILMAPCHGAGANASSRIRSGALLIRKETCW